jgi:NhaP-type Na+/H+ or K+/H+ antiporter
MTDIAAMFIFGFLVGWILGLAVGWAGRTSLTRVQQGVREP